MTTDTTITVESVQNLISRYRSDRARLDPDLAARYPESVTDFNEWLETFFADDDA